MYEGVVIESLIKEDIINAIDKYEPRIVVTDNDIQIVQESQKVNIYIQYEIKNTDQINSYNMEITPEDNPYNK